LDIVTQGILGAAVGHAVLGHRIGGKAVALGFLGGIAPDLDVLWSGDARSLDYWQYHRGITHSLFFGPTAGLAAAGASWLVDRWRSRAATPFGLWYLFYLAVLVTHVLLDLATHWGTAILAPFSQARYGVPAVPVIAPIYTSLLVGALVYAFGKGVRSGAARHMVLGALALSTVYLGMGWGQNLRAERLAEADLEAAGVETQEVHAYTTMFSLWLRRVVAVTDDAHLVGFVSTLKPQPIAWTSLRRDAAVEAMAEATLAGTPEWAVYRNFANGPLHIELAPHDGNPVGGSELRLHDLRFGFPNDSVAGLWGMKAVLDHRSRLVAASRFSSPREIQDGDLVAMVRAKLGLPQHVF